jgi:hypothetical protein
VEKSADYMTEVFKEWKDAKPSIAYSFKMRERKLAREPMVYFFKRFLEILYIGNGYVLKEDDVSLWKKKISELQHLPVNAIERLSFINEQPDHYQSFIQLSELFAEWEKKTVILARHKT